MGWLQIALLGWEGQRKAHPECLNGEPHSHISPVYPYLFPIPDPHPNTSVNFYQHILFPGEFAATMQQPHIIKLRFKYEELIWFMPNDSFKASGTQKKGKTPVTSPEDEHFEIS